MTVKAVSVGRAPARALPPPAVAKSPPTGPVIVTVNGRPDVVLLDATVFERKLKTLNLAELLAEGEADIKAGRVRPARAFLKTVKRGKKIPR